MHSELPAPVVIGGNASGVAGEDFSIMCNFTLIPNLITIPTVHWMNSIDSVLSDTNVLSLSPLLTSHGGQYTCIVNINITQLNLSLTGSGTTNIIVDSKFSKVL